MSNRLLLTESRQALETWLQDNQATLRPWSSESSTETWLESPDWRLRRAGLAVRTRTDGEDAIAELVAIDDLESPLHARPAGPNLAANLPDLQVLLGPKKLEPIAQLDRHRDRQALELADELVGELTFERWAVGEAATTVVDVGGRTPASLIDGLVAAGLLDREAPDRLTAALTLAEHLPPPRPDFGSTEITAELSAAEVALAILRRQWTKVLDRESGTRIGRDIEELHDMRVAVRRMRAAISLFCDDLPEAVLELKEPLSHTGRVLGEVRDLDVQIEQFEAWERELEEPALATLGGRLKTDWEMARRKLLRFLDSKRWGEIQERVAGVLIAGAEGAPTRPICEAGPKIISRARRQVVKPGRRLRPDSPADEFHDLRVRAKKFRYALEFHREIYGRVATRMIRALVDIQDLLGQHQDDCVALERLETMIRGRRLPAAAIFAIGRIAERRHQRITAAQRDFPSTLRHIDKKRWRQLRAAMAEALGEVAVPAAEPVDTPIETDESPPVAE